MDERIAGLFEKMKAKNLFWSYSKKALSGETAPDILVETVLKYGDVEDIRLVFECYDTGYIREVWIRRLLFDNRFRKLNFYLGNIFFDVDPDRVRRERKNDDRANKLRMLASCNTAGIDKP